MNQYKKNHNRINMSHNLSVRIKNTTTGVTLISLAITICIMMILAGIVLERVNGENGVVTETMNASIIHSKSVLQEYINVFYAENSLNFSEYDTKIEAIKGNSESAAWIYTPEDEIIIDGYTIYLINKEALPERVKSQIKEGDAGGNNAQNYSDLKDVYGITSDLQVYYCSDGIETILGLEREDLN